MIPVSGFKCHVNWPLYLSSHLWREMCQWTWSTADCGNSYKIMESYSHILSCGHQSVCFTELSRICPSRSYLGVQANCLVYSTTPSVTFFLLLAVHPRDYSQTASVYSTWQLLRTRSFRKWLSWQVPTCNGHCTHHGRESCDNSCYNLPYAMYLLYA